MHADSPHRAVRMQASLSIIGDGRAAPCSQGRRAALSGQASLPASCSAMASPFFFSMAPGSGSFPRKAL